MISARRSILIGIAALAALGGGLGVRRLFEARPPLRSDPSSVFQLVLSDLEGQLQDLTQWKGKIFVANFWATWCEPCREEIPALIKIQTKYASKNVQIVGISIDSADKIRQFTLTPTINYPLVMGGIESLNVLRHMGNQAGVLPYTAVFKPDGQVAYRHAGPLTEDALDKVLKPLMV